MLFHRFFSLSSFSALFSLLYSDQTPSLLFLPSLFLLCWVRCLGRGWRRGSVVVVVFGVVVGCGSAWLGRGRGLASWDEASRWSWNGDWRGSLVVDRRAGMKWVVGRGSTAEVGHWSLVVGRGWVVAEVALVMIFFEWVCSDGFQIVVGSWSWLGFKSAPLMIFFYRRGFVFVCVCARGWGSLRKKKRLESPEKWNHA